MSDSPFPTSGNKYRVVRVIGRGSSGKAVLVTPSRQSSSCSSVSSSFSSSNNNLLFNNVNNGEVLLVAKQIPLSGLSKEKKSSAVNEAKLLGIASDHPNILQLHEYFVRNDVLYIVTEYCENGDLAKHIQKVVHQQQKSIPEKQILQWLIGISSALEFLHAKRIVHRDIKPTNVLLTKSGDAKIGDFGIATVLAHDNFAETQVGTPFYLAPEICQSVPYDNKTDIWALGCLVYECCCGKPPFPSDSLASLVNKILNAQPQPITNKAYSKTLIALISRMLKKDPNQRPSASEVLVAARSIKASLEETKTQSPPEATSHSSASRRVFNFFSPRKSDTKMEEKQLSASKSRKEPAEEKMERSSRMSSQQSKARDCAVSNDNNRRLSNMSRGSQPTTYSRRSDVPAKKPKNDQNRTRPPTSAASVRVAPTRSSRSHSVTEYDERFDILMKRSSQGKKPATRPASASAAAPSSALSPIPNVNNNNRGTTDWYKERVSRLEKIKNSQK